MSKEKLPINEIIQGDCLEVLKTFPSNSVDCVVTSPPYNKGLYDKHTPHPSDAWRQRNVIYGEFKDNLPREEYVKQQTDLLAELVRLIKPEGSIFYNHKAIIHDHQLDYPDYVFRFNVRQQIIWDRGSSPQLAPIRWFPSSEYIFWITKGQVQPKFKRTGKFNGEVWRINPLPMKEHPAPFPEALVNQCLEATTDEGDIVLDPYSGSGTTAKVAHMLNRKFVGIEMNEEYIVSSKERLRMVANKMF